MSRLPDDFVQEIFNDLERLRVEFAAARANFRAAEEDRKIVKAQIKRTQNTSIAAAEDFALAHPKYKAAVQTMVKAGEDADNAEWKLKIKTMEFEAWRTLSANERMVRS